MSASTSRTTTVTQEQAYLRLQQRERLQSLPFVQSMQQSNLFRTDRMEVIRTWETSFRTTTDPLSALVTLANEVILPTVLEQQGNISNQTSLLSYYIQVLRASGVMSSEALHFLDAWESRLLDGKFNNDLVTALSMLVPHVFNPEILRQDGNLPHQIALLGFQDGLGTVINTSRGQVVYELALEAMSLEDSFGTLENRVDSREQAAIQEEQERYDQARDQIQEAIVERDAITDRLRTGLEANVERNNRLELQKRNQAQQVKELGKRLADKDKKLKSIIDRGLK